MPDPEDLTGLLDRAAAGDAAAVTELFSRYRKRLKRMVRLRLSRQRQTVEKLAEEFVERYRRGERSPLSEFTARDPEHADEIRDLFPALVMMERIAPESDACSLAAAPVSLRERPIEHPARLGDYRILGEIGRGGMGVVYEAEQVSLGRHVALKVLPQQFLFDARHQKRFEREARAAARLHHTNIVPVFGVGDENGLH
jgi:serine/threonine protein kinase